MKKAFLLLCFLIGIGLTQISAQNGKNGNEAVPEFNAWDGYYIDIPVQCNYAEVDRLVGKVTYHVVRFYKLGEFVREITCFTGEVTSTKTGEVFNVKDHWKVDLANLPGSGHNLLKGNKGSQYIIFYTLDYETDTFTFEKAVCK
jgi:hypothetical protein